MDKKTFIASGLIEKYILGLTSEEEDGIVEEWMEKDAAIKDQIFNAQDGLFDKVKGYAKEAPLDTKSNILKEINRLESEDQYTNVSPSIGNILKYAAIAVLGITSFYFWNDGRQQAAQVAQLGLELDNCSETMAAIDQEKAALVSNEYILTHSATETVRLRGTNMSPDASISAFYNPVAEVLMIKVNKLPPPPDGKYYHMWADVEGKMVHVGSLSNDAVQLTSLNFVSEAESLNVTLEDEATVDHPTVSQLALSGRL